ncbi:DNA-methyltransferase [Vagococcus lutrae]|uniref:DNA-methyltransferase n=1 Tax=Vagococcus lutrae TaxID=81947 RepID=UPI0028A24BB1|nr:site-specific DNA-methyltransferase [Vagococcus lutrae]
MELNKIYNEDCLIGMKSIADKSVDVTVTDIPYGVVSRSSNGLRNLNKGKADIFALDLNELLNDIERVTKGQIVVFCGKEQFSEIFEYFSKKKGTTRLLVWEKTNPSPMNGQYVYLSGVELAVWFKPRGRKVFNAHCKNTVLKHSNGSRKIHPTQKNIKLFEEIIADNTNVGEIVLDPFMGSGTTAIACMNTNRNFIGFEIDETYHKLSLERLEEHKKAMN